MNTPREILEFWFDGNLGRSRPIWFERNDAFDAAISARFGDLVIPAREGELDDWAADAEGALALLLLLDQFPRNLFRGQSAAFASDPHARAVARTAVLERRQDLAFGPVPRGFFYLPFEHGEAMADQNLSVTLFEGLRDDPSARKPGGGIDYAWRHWQVIARFGRFPHRNRVLGRPNTQDEAAYLALPGAGF
ncbi:DUF924 family protein [Roseomonas marmotae]|uniref:DUF924 domain-containing protein n=1 Tax=Roseomonas marmotae TaxID=2768161 RepID=A0ABS3KGZ3_9PROT|nr:DUF924 family protein [Roseomonas marmotae]MBO1076734.1 DUF924 domain-containing protein [Roseomonas marmotae]QTI77978.1 DUF924 domain-containing protein [Roseomonas marmotae]